MQTRRTQATDEGTQKTKQWNRKAEDERKNLNVVTGITYGRASGGWRWRGGNKKGGVELVTLSEVAVSLVMFERIAVAA